MAYLIIKWVHVLAAILAIGTNATYGLLLLRASRDAQNVGFSLRAIKSVNDRMANPAYGLLLILGVAMILIGKISITTPWLMTAVALYVILLLIGWLGYTPTLRQRIEMLDQSGVSSLEFTALTRRATTLGIIMGVIAFAIVYFMVVKPIL
jgi:uncharacterized membrane protein